MNKTSVGWVILVAGSVLGIACSSQSGARVDAAGGKGPSGGAIGGAGATGGITGVGGEVSRGGSTGTGGATGGSALDAAADSGAGVDSSDDATDDASAGGICATDDDCIAVLNYRTGFECWWPSPAAKADVGRDPCLIPWKPNPRCTTAQPPAYCPAGNRPVTHSCPTTSCIVPTCIDGRCTNVIDCSKRDAGPAQPDCETLRAAYFIALAAAQQCYPSAGSSACQGVLVDPCGCRIPYDSSGICGDAVSAALNDWRNAGCTGPSCGGTCALPGAAGAACVSNDVGTTGTCAWQ